jgi:BMFP domain-containing protein YqiC
MEDIVNRLESFNEWCQSAESKQVMKDAAEAIRNLRREVEALKGDEE